MRFFYAKPAFSNEVSYFVLITSARHSKLGGWHLCVLANLFRMKFASL